MSRYVYHAPWEPRPRAVASGTQNIVGLGLGMPSPGYYESDLAQRGLVYRGLPTPICPAWGCGGRIPTWPPDSPPTHIYPYPPYPGATSTVPQPPPNMGPIGAPVVAGGYGLPISPAPSPTVPVPTSQTAPQLTQPGTVLDSSGASVTTASGIGTWLGESTLIHGVPNWGLAAGALAALMFFGKSGGRR